jgi:hypothetical protein
MGGAAEQCGGANSPQSGLRRVDSLSRLGVGVRCQFVTGNRKGRQSSKYGGEVETGVDQFHGKFCHRVCEEGLSVISGLEGVGGHRGKPDMS